MLKKEELKPLFERLKLTLIKDTIDDDINQAIKENWSYTELIKKIFTSEIENRDQKLLNKRIKKSGINTNKTLENFDFNFNKKVPEKIIKELATVKFIEKKENIFFIGQSGIGKSHLANAIGLEACIKNYNVIYKRVTDLLDYLHSGNSDLSFQKKYKEIIEVPLLILDDFGITTLHEKYQIYLYEIMNDRYEKVSTIITSNKSFNEWINVFNNPLMANAFIDRLMHNAITVNIVDAESYRKKIYENKQKNVFDDII